MLLLHKILVIDAELASPLDPKQKDISTKSFISDLLKTLGMKKLGNLQIYAATDKKYPGWSFIQPITTSHISGHYFQEDKGSHIHLDFYSKIFNWKKALFCANKHFTFKKWDASLLDRSNDTKKRKCDHYKGVGAIIAR